jgi:uncharacterized RDD family membrane protein YckC
MIAYEGAWVCADCKDLFFQRVREGIVPTLRPGSLRYAGFWIRCVAILIDSCVFAALIGAMVLIGSLAGSLDADMVVLMSYLFLLVVATIYEVWMVSVYGATLGKLALNLRIVRANGQKLTWGRAFGRCLSKFFVSGLVPAHIGYIMAGLTDQKRALHDMICDTRVIWKHSA